VFDGWSCYDCGYCVDTYDDSACESPMDCCGMCGGSADMYSDCFVPGCSDYEIDCNGDGTECVSSSWACDGWSDCYNGADEVDCGTGCSDYEFDCGDGNCIYGSSECDGITDCYDGSDEP
jgi:hypothetical protein